MTATRYKQASPEPLTSFSHDRIPIAVTIEHRLRPYLPHRLAPNVYTFRTGTLSDQVRPYPHPLKKELRKPITLSSTSSHTSKPIGV
jgi:hypothetical protein